VRCAHKRLCPWEFRRSWGGTDPGRRSGGLKGSHAFTLELRGRDNRTYADVSGTYPVIGPYRDAGFIVGTDQGARSVCRSASCEWYTEHASIVRGAPEETTSFEIRVKGATADSLIESLRPRFPSRAKRGVPGLMRFAKRLHGFSASHRRLALFWLAAIGGLLLPWIASCHHPSELWQSAFRQERDCAVHSIHDGDTMRLTCAGQHLKVRLYCIDAPELSQRPWGQESRDHLRSITPRRVILIPKDKDGYGRTVGEILADDVERENLNLAQVANGNVAVYPKYCSHRSYYAAERQARRAQSGIWKRLGEQRSPWVYRHAH
jgi:endonuclease YncB( thermonuclease family)